MPSQRVKPGKPMLEKTAAAVFDTHIWLRVSAGDPQLGALQNFRGTAIVPAISVWDQWIRENLQPPVRLEPLHPEISLESCRLQDFHGDPADRLIVATALVLGVPLITADRQIIGWNKHHARLQIIPADSLAT